MPTAGPTWSRAGWAPTWRPPTRLCPHRPRRSVTSSSAPTGPIGGWGPAPPDALDRLREGVRRHRRRRAAPPWRHLAGGDSAPPVAAAPDKRALDYLGTARYQRFWPQQAIFALPTFSDTHLRVNVAGREGGGTVAPRALPRRPRPLGGSPRHAARRPHRATGGRRDRAHPLGRSVRSRSSRRSGRALRPVRSICSRTATRAGWGRCRSCAPVSTGRRASCGSSTPADRSGSTRCLEPRALGDLLRDLVLGS